jgi:hypothetical protein
MKTWTFLHALNALDNSIPASTLGSASALKFDFSPLAVAP